MNLNLKDSAGNLKYYVAGSVCQLGLLPGCFSWCCGVNFDVKDASGNSVGNIEKPALTFCEMCKGTNRFRVNFPADAVFEDRALLVGAMMHLDLQYFEVRQTNDGDATE